MEDPCAKLFLFICLVSANQCCLSDDARNEFFEKRVRPILANHCFECHGPEKQESNLRIDHADGLRQGGDSGPAVVPRDLNSLVLTAVRRTSDLKMPPDQPLAEKDVAALERWIADGMYWPDDALANADGPQKQLWALQPIKIPTIPETSNHSWPQSEIDHFILARIEKANLTPGARAGRRTLIRRATFDLHGLPPSYEDVEAFANDSTPNAFAKLVDRLLDSPAYGERWGRHWLDVARYADNKGYVFFEEKEFPWAWTFRDWVIESFNRDLPFNQFVKYQLAADQLTTESNRRHLAAMGFLTVGARFSNNIHDVIDDRIDVVCRGFLGLTVTCARCHDHKFDPIPQADYYSLYGVFRSSVEPTIPPLFQIRPSSPEFQRFEKELQQRIDKLQEFVAKQTAQIKSSARQRVTEYLLAVRSRRHHPITDNFMLLTESGALNPNMIRRWEVYLKTKGVHDPVWGIWSRFYSLDDNDFRAKARGVHDGLFVDSTITTEETRWNPLVASRFHESPQEFKSVAEIYGALFQQIHQEWNQLLQKAETTGQPLPTEFSDRHKEQIRQCMYGKNCPAMIPQTTGWGFLDLLPDRPIQEEFKKLLKDVETFSAKQPSAPPRAMTLVDSTTLYDPVIFQRGNPNRRGKSVPRQFLTALSVRERESFEHGSGRLKIAEQLVSPENPLVARVFVNRVWRWHFGTGLVETPSDFGFRSERPSHPDLLDWLSNWFIQNDWSVKKLHRLIMNTAVYQQTCESKAQNAQRIDPENRLLSRFNRRRLDFESIRDSMLSVSGMLDRTIRGGKPTPLDENSRCRTVYCFVDRMDLPTVLRTFDFPEPAATSPKRDATTIPTQSLFFLNGGLITRSSRFMARNLEPLGASTNDRIATVFQSLFARQPAREELEIATRFLQQNLKNAKNGSSEDGWQRLIQALMMTNEFVFID